MATGCMPAVRNNMAVSIAAMSAAELAGTVIKPQYVSDQLWHVGGAAEPGPAGHGRWRHCGACL